MAGSTKGLTAMQPEIDNSQPLALRPREAAKALGVSPRFLWTLTKGGRIPCVILGSGKRKTVLYSVASLKGFLEPQPNLMDSQQQPQRGDLS